MRSAGPAARVGGDGWDRTGGWGRPQRRRAREELSRADLRRHDQGRQGFQRVLAPHPGGVPGWLHVLGDLSPPVPGQGER